MKQKNNKLLICILIILSFFSVAVRADEETIKDGRPLKDGFLSVEGTNLVNENGEKVILRGVSTHGLTWYPQFVNETLFKDISEHWKCDLLRLVL